MEVEKIVEVKEMGDDMVDEVAKEMAKEMAE